MTCYPGAARAGFMRDAPQVVSFCQQNLHATWRMQSFVGHEERLHAGVRTLYDFTALQTATALCQQILCYNLLTDKEGPRIIFIAILVLQMSAHNVTCDCSQDDQTLEQNAWPQPPCLWCMTMPAVCSLMLGQ